MLATGCNSASCIFCCLGETRQILLSFTSEEDEIPTNQTSLVVMDVVQNLQQCSESYKSTGPHCHKLNRIPRTTFRRSPISPSNMRFQPTACGARDCGGFTSTSCSAPSSAAEAWSLGGRLVTRIPCAYFMCRIYFVCPRLRSSASQRCDVFSIFTDQLYKENTLCARFQSLLSNLPPSRSDR